MRPLTLQLASKNGYLNLIILTGLLSGTLITTFIWLEVPNRIITPLSWFSLGLIGLGSFLYLRDTTTSRSRWMMILAALAAVSLVYLFPELFGPACGGMPRAFALNCDPKCRIEICTKWVEGPSPECPKPGPGGGCCLSHTTECDPDCEPPPPPNQPPTIQGSLSCSQWGLNGWCASSLSLQLSAVEPQGQNVMISGDINGTAFACSASAGTFTCPVPLPEGSMTANYTATSSTGLTASGSTSFKRDSVKPVIDGWLNGTAGSNSWFISSVDVNASASDPQPGSGMSAFEFKLNSAAWKSYTGSINLLDGIHSFNLRANDKAGNLVETNQTIQIDTITPVLNLSVIGTSGANGWYTSTLQINASASDSGSGLSTFEYNLDDTGWISYSNPFELTDGIHSLNFRVIDNAGNNTEGSQTFQVDTLAPVINLSVIGTEGANSWYTSSVQINASVNDAGSGVSALEVSVDGGVWNVYSGPLFFTDGTHTYQFRATDNAGNLNETTAQQVLVDTISPVIDLPESWELGQNTIFKLQDNGSGLASLRLVVEDEDERFPKVSWEEYLKSYKFKGEINWNGRFKDGQVAPSGGEYYARVKVRDVAGNESIRAGQVIVPVASLVEELFLSLGNQTGELISKTEASEIIVELPVPFASDSAKETPSQSTSTSAPSIINLGGNSNKAAKTSSIQAEKTSFNAGGITNSPISPNNLSNILWGATATAALGAFVAEAARKREALEAAQRAANAVVYKARKLKKQVYALSQQLKKQTEAINQALRNQTAYARVFGKKEVEIEKELRSNLTKAQAEKDALERAKQKAYDIYRAQEVAAQTKITSPKEAEKSLQSWLEQKVTQTAMSPRLGRYGVGTQIISDSLRSIGDPNRNPRTAEAHKQVWSGIAAWEAIFNMRKEARKYTTQSINDGRWSDVFRGISTLTKQNLTVATGTVVAAGMALWGVITTPIRIFIHDIPEFYQAGKERMEGKDRFWDVLFTATNFAGDVTALYGGYQVAGRMNIINKINSTAADHFGIGVIKRTYAYEGVEYIYRYNPYKKAALGNLEDLGRLQPAEYNLLKDIPDEIYSNTSIQSDFLRDIANSKVEPTYFSNPNLNKKRVFSHVEHRFLTKLRGMFPEWWKNVLGKQWKLIFNGLLSHSTRR